MPKGKFIYYNKMPESELAQIKVKHGLKNMKLGNAVGFAASLINITNALVELTAQFSAAQMKHVA